MVPDLLRVKIIRRNVCIAVAEVIQRGLLMKIEASQDQLSEIYQVQSNNFDTLFGVTDGLRAYPNLQDQAHFINFYSFIPYQFEIFQSALQSLSDHNAFEGQHRSVGEWSILGVFQQVAMQISDSQVGQLATFDLMFEGIRSTLKSQVQLSISATERNLDDPFAIRVLKALFLVKYVREFKATLSNLCILLLDRFEADLPELHRRVEAALDQLELQTYIQRQGIQYQYLTDEEKDMEQEIKSTQIESADISDELDKLVFDGILKDRKDPRPKPAGLLLLTGTGP